MDVKIGFDFDKVLIDYPPIVPSFVIDFFYKKHFNVETLTYRIPGNLEQKIRIASHHPLLRNPISDNVASVKKIAERKNTQTYLISSRFAFLKERTEEVLVRTGLNKTFKQTYFNYDNKQPHVFKKNIIKKLKIKKYIDDDYDLLEYISRHCPQTELYWLTTKSKKKRAENNRITPITSIEEFRKKYLNK